MATVSNVDDNDNNNKIGHKSQRQEPAHPSLTPKSTSIVGKEYPGPPPSTFTAPRIQTSTFSSTTSPIPSLQRQGVSREAALLPKGAQQTIECSTDYHRWDGYNHSKVIKTSPVASATHKIPPWLKDMSQLPPLPVIGDPGLFLNFYELKAPLPPKKGPRRNPNLYRFRNAYSTEFRSLAFEGDLALAFFSRSILSNLFGPESRLLGQCVYSDWTSNTTWQELAMIYRLDEYVGWFPESLREGGVSKNRDKFWADIWEAWWACLLSEREMWGDSVDDLVSVLRRIIELKYWRLLETYSSVLQIHAQESMIYHVNFHEDDIREVWRGDADICESLGPDLASHEIGFLGYLVPVGSDFSVYCEERQAAVQIAELCSKHGHKATKRRISSLNLYPPDKAGNSIRQRSFDFLVETCFGNPQPLSTKFHLIPLLSRIQDLRQENIQIGTCPANHLIRIFWYEARLAARLGEYSTVVNALVFVISYCAMNYNRNKKVNRLLLDQCLYLHEEVLIANDNIYEDSVNFVLKYISVRGGKLIIHEREKICWGEEMKDIVLAVRFDGKGYLAEREELGNLFCPFDFLSAWCDKNGS